MSTNAIGSERDVALAPEKKMGLPDNKRDKAGDQQILDCLSSQEPLTNRVVQYGYNHRSYTLRIISNPQKKCIVAGNLRFFFQSALISKEPLPSELKQHLLKLFEDKLGKSNPGFLSEGSISPGKPDFEIFQSVNLTEEAVPSLDMKNFSFTLPKVEIPSILTKKDEIPAFKQPSISQPRFQPRPIMTVSCFDAATDEKIKELLNSAVFTKRTFDYAFGNTNYRIFVLNNPQKASLWSEGLPEPASWDFVMTCSTRLPFDLDSHLRNLALAEASKQNRDKYKIVFAGFIPTHNIREHENLQPITISPPDKLETFDEDIRECLRSKELVNRVFIYQLKSKIYKVRIIYRPNGEDVSTTLQNKDYGNIRFCWSHKYGILIDEPASQELISHLEKVFNLGWWDRFWNFSVNNGQPMIIQTTDYKFRSRESAFDLFKKKS